MRTRASEAANCSEGPKKTTLTCANHLYLRTFRVYIRPAKALSLSPVPIITNSFERVPKPPHLAQSKTILAARLRIQQSYDNKAVQVIVSFAASDRNVSEAGDKTIVLMWLNPLKVSLMRAYGETEEAVASGLMGQNICMQMKKKKEEGECVTGHTCFYFGRFSHLCQCNNACAFVNSIFKEPTVTGSNGSRRVTAEIGQS